MAGNSAPDVHVGEVVVDLVVTEGVGPLSPEDVKALVRIVLDQMRREQEQTADRTRDTTIHDRVFRPSLG